LANNQAISVGNKEIIRYLIDEGIQCLGDQDGQLPIHFACLKGDIDIVRIIRTKALFN
jgi:ankyrin repeat protein